MRNDHRSSLVFSLTAFFLLQIRPAIIRVRCNLNFYCKGCPWHCRRIHCHLKQAVISFYHGHPFQSPVSPGNTHTYNTKCAGKFHRPCRHQGAATTAIYPYWLFYHFECRRCFSFVGYSNQLAPAVSCIPPPAQCGVLRRLRRSGRG